jgi:hypothetical protein
MRSEGRNITRKVDGVMDSFETFKNEDAEYKYWRDRPRTKWRDQMRK